MQLQKVLGGRAQGYALRQKLALELLIEQRQNLAFGVVAQRRSAVHHQARPRESLALCIRLHNGPANDASRKCSDHKNDNERQINSNE